jgi:hypothetical protein
MLEDALKVLDWIGYVSTVLVLGTAVVATWLCFRGFVPVLVRLGNGLWRRRIAIFANAEALVAMENLLRDSRLFNHANVLKVPGRGDLGIAERADIFLVHWPSCESFIDEILQKKSDRVPLIVYAPQEHGQIPKSVMIRLERQRNVVVNNFRGRLLNDIVTSMITTGYEKD